MTRILIGTVLFALMAYGAIETRPLIMGPSLTIDSPANGASYPDGMVTVAGRAGRATTLTLNGAPVSPDQEGRFSTTLAFPAGGSILTVGATDRFGRRVSTTRTIYVNA